MIYKPTVTLISSVVNKSACQLIAPSE